MATACCEPRVLAKKQKGSAEASWERWARIADRADLRQLKRGRHLLAAGAAVLSMTVTVLVPVPASAQIGGIVHDPCNYAQNILTAARTLEQINACFGKSVGEAREHQARGPSSHSCPVGRSASTTIGR